MKSRDVALSTSRGADYPLWRAGTPRASRRRGASIRVVAAVLTLALGGCSTLDTVNLLSSKSGSTRTGAIAYGAHPRHVADVYEPDRPLEDAPVILFFYGGAWVAGERAEYEFVARRLASMGYYAVIPDYRLFPEVTFPCFVLDGAQAAAYVLDHMEALFGERRSLFVAGHSAGAHIAMLLAVDERYMAQTGRSRDDIAGVIGIAGPYDFLPIGSDSLRRIFPTPMAQWASQPVNFVGPKTPPVLLAHGDRDGTVWLRNSVNMADRLTAEGGDVSLKIYRGLDHRDVLKPFVSFFRDRAGILGDIDEFVAKHNGRFTIRSRAGGYVWKLVECDDDGVY